MPVENELKYIIPWSGRSVRYTRKEVISVVRAMKYADPLTQGRYQRELESVFAQYLKVKHAFAVSSCTAALELAAVLSRIGPVDEVIIPAHTFCATAIPFARTKARIVWADIDPDTRVVSAKAIADCISKKTKVIVVVHLYGLMANMEPIMRLARKHNCLVVEDCAQAIGAEYKDKKAGSFGDFSCFSFHCQKSVTTLGEGGMLVVKSGKTAKLVPGMRHNGVRSFSGSRERFWVPAMANVDFDLAKVWPYNFCIGEVQCALGIESLKILDKLNDRRIKRANKVIAALKRYPELSFQRVGGKKMHVYHLLSAKYDGAKFDKTNHDLISLLNYKYRIKAIVQYYPLYRYPMFKKAGFGKADCPNTDKFFDNMVSFPFHLWMSQGQLEYMISCIIKSLEELRNND